MRVSGAAWQLIPAWVHCISIVTTILGDCVEKLIELLFHCDKAFDSLFATTVQLFHRTWREMHASRDEHEKVHPSLYIVTIFFSKICFTLKAMQPHDVVSLFHLQVLFSELRNLLKPSIEQLIRINRKNILKQGFTFRRQVKGKTPHKGEGEDILFLILLQLYISLHKCLAVTFHVFPSN
uniref:Secreted protein n=1 Tax=Angiostrongylus cantonensis TaxID=6313 RepID=A0A0K0DD97_ANGCA